MNTRSCPSCGCPLEPNDLAIAEEVVSCRECTARVPAAVAPEADTSNVIVQTVPDDCWVEDRGGDAVVGTTVRDGIGCFMLVWTVGWNGIFSVVVVHLIKEWIQYLSHGTMSGGLLFKTLFFTPFVLFGIASALFCVFNLFGKLEITIGTETVRVFRGVGPIGWVRRVETRFAGGARIKDLTIDPTDGRHYCIEIGAFTPIRFGSMLPDDRKKWVCVAVDAAIRARSGNVRPTNAYR